MELHPDQIAAIEMATNPQTKVCLITGPPGSGKSTILKEIATRLGSGRALYLAPTGKAAQVVQSSVGAETVLTVAKMKTSPPVVSRFARGTVVVDESSMVDVAMFDEITRELDPERLVLMGDAEQLPPIGSPTSVLEDLGWVDWIPRVKLSRVFRQTAGTALSKSLDVLREGTHISSKAFDTSDFSFGVAVRGSDDDVDAAISKIFSDSADARPRPTVICMTNSTRQRLNAVIQKKVNPRGKVFPFPYNGKSTDKDDDEIREGDPVVCRKNAYAPRLGLSSKKREGESRPSGPKKKSRVSSSSSSGIGGDAAVGLAGEEGGENSDDDEDDEENSEEGKMVVANGTTGIACVENDVPLVRYTTIDSRGRVGIYEDKYDFTRKKFKTRKFQAGYCLVVDSAQGATIDDVVVVLDDDKRGIDRKHLYVGISRAKNSCLLLCDDGAVDDATRPCRTPLSAFSTLLKEIDFSTFSSSTRDS